MKWLSCGVLAFLALTLVTGTALTLMISGGPQLTRADYRRPDKIPYPESNPYSSEKEELGRALFFDSVLSRSQSFSCASCHNPSLSWSDDKPRAIGEAHTPLAFRAPTLQNVAWTDILGWDGKFPNLEAVAYTPIMAPGNMNMTEEEVNQRLRANPRYVELFRQAFTDGAIDRKNVELALATFQRSIVSPKSPFDTWVEGDDTAIDERAKRGFAIFNGKGACAECHSGWNFTDGSFHDIGSAKDNDIGRGRLFPTSAKLRYAFKTPTLRNVFAQTSYMHDGSIATLEKVIELYDRGGIERPSRSQSVKRLNLTQDEKTDLIAFLKTLSSQY